ncbi:MAG: hypothetical protein QOH08_2385 [Chloroflexota bacterium]|nr:hypothetical protein [Chloroflexota bacterium]
MAGPVSSSPIAVASPVASALPQSAVPTPSLAPGTCTRAGMTNEDVTHRWLELAGRHDAPAVRDCFAASYGIPDQVVARWADLSPVSRSTVEHEINAISNGCDRFSVSATFPNGNPYAPVQSPNEMFLVIGMGTDGDRPRIFGTATATVRRSPDVTPHTGPPDCR